MVSSPKARPEQAGAVLLDETRLRLLSDQVPAIVWTVDRELRFTSGMGAGLARLGLERETLAGVSLSQYFQDEGAPPLAAHRLALAGGSVSYEMDWAGRTYQAHVEPFRDAAGAIIGVVGVALDITERRRAEAERDRLLQAERDARAAAEEALRAREEFLSIASHELSTPLMSLQMSVQTLKRALERPEPPPPNLIEIAENQCRRLGRLVDELLSVTRLASGRLDAERVPIDVVELVESMLEGFEQCAARAGCELSFSGDRSVVLGDHLQLERVVTNLFSNAIKYGTGEPVDIRVEAGDAVVRLLVIDHGIGVPEAARSAIFERYGRSVHSRHYGGLGLGLYIARALVEQHGGRIAVSDTPGGGATFTVELPRVRRAAEEP